MKKAILILLTLLTQNLPAQDITGQWNGVLDLGGMQLRIVFHISADGDQYKATMDSPDQGAKDIPTTSTTFSDKDKILTIIADALGMKYEATLSNDGTQLDGTFTQGPAQLPLKMTREKVEKKELPPRPQDPTDFPYTQEAVTIENPKGGHHLAGTLTIPEGGNFDKVVVLLSGSGPQNRDEEIAQFNHRPFLVLSDHLTRQGIAVLRYDDRGVGESGGEFKGATTRDFADDAHAAVDYLHSRPDMSNKKIGLIGHSEGGMIAPMVASESERVGFIVLLAGPGIPIDELMLLQRQKISDANGVPKVIQEVNNNILTDAYQFIKKSTALSKPALKAGLRTLFEKHYASFSEEAKADIGDKDRFFDREIESLTDDWFLYFIRFDPDTYLSKVTCPTLALNGSLDLQVTPTENLEGIRRSLEKAGNGNVVVREIEGVNHLFQPATTGAPSEYGEIEVTMEVEVLGVVGEWVLGR